MANVYLRTKFYTNIFNGHYDMLQKYKSKIGADTILNFAKSGILGYSNAYLANIHQCTKFDENIFIYDWAMAKNRKFKTAAAAILKGYFTHWHRETKLVLHIDRAIFCSVWKICELCVSFN